MLLTSLLIAVISASCSDFFCENLNFLLLIISVMIEIRGAAAPPMECLLFTHYKDMLQ